MFNFLLLYNVIFILNAFLINAQLSDKRQCGNEKCTAVIGEGKTIQTYSRGVADPRLLSFKANQLIKIYSKEAGSNTNLWGIDVNGRRGYAPSRFLRETKVHMIPTFLVDVESLSDDVPSNSKSETSETPTPTNKYVVDGTTIYSPYIDPSSTEKSVQPSVHPNLLQTDSLPDAANQNTQDNSQSLHQFNNGNEKNVISELHPSIEKANISSQQSTTDTSELSKSNEKLTPESDNKIPLKLDLKEENVEKGIESRLDEKIKYESGSEQPLKLDVKEGNVEEVESKSNKKEPLESHNEKPVKSDQKEGTMEEKGESKLVKTETSDRVTEQLLKLDQKDGIVGETKSFTAGNSDGSIGINQNNPALDSEPSMVNSIMSHIKGFMDDEAEDDEEDEDSSVEEEDDDDDAEIESEMDEEIQQEGEKNLEQEQLNKEVEPSVDRQTDTKSKTNIQNELQLDSANQVIAGQGSESVSFTSHQNSENSESIMDVRNGHYAPSKYESTTEKEDANHTHRSVPLGQPSVESSNLQDTVATSESRSENLLKYDINSQSLKSGPETIEGNTQNPPKVNEDEIIPISSNHQHTHASETKSELGQTSEDVNKMQFEDQLDATVTVEGHNESETQGYTNHMGALHDHNFAHENIKNYDATFPQNENNDLSINNNLKMHKEHSHFDNFGESLDHTDTTLNSETVAAESLVERAVVTESNNPEPIRDEVELHLHDINTLLSHQRTDELSCTADCKLEENIEDDKKYTFELPIISYKILIVLVITAVTVVVFLWGYTYIEKRGREGILIGKINDLQKQFLIMQKEKELLTNKLIDIESEFNEKSNAISSEALLNLREELEEERNARSNAEAQVKTLEKDLENSTEVGLELNRMLSQFLSSENGSEMLVANIEQLQRQIVEQQDIINSYNDNLNIKETENHELRLEVDINNTKVTDLQSELNKMALILLKLEEDRDASQSMYENQLESVKAELEERKSLLLKETNNFNEQMKNLNDKYDQLKRDFEMKSNEYSLLRDNINQLKKTDNNSDSIKALLDISTVQAEMLQLRKDKQLLTEQVQIETNKNSTLEGQYQAILHDLSNTKQKYDLADREKVEAVTKLEVLDKYFKEREAQLQRELSKQETMWIEKQGEATSTIERIKYMQEELQNYKAQNESLKQEILEQEVQMKSQISMLEKKVNENWVTARQLERKLDDAKQEAAQLRNRLTLQERTFNEEKLHNRIQSPIEHNGDIQITPTHISNDTAPSPSLMFGGRENLTMSPSLPGLPFLPPPPGVPFMPPPLGAVPLPPPSFMPPPPSLLPGDHRPPPLGRISSPPLNSRYPHDRAYSPYSRNSPSPTSDDDYSRMPMPPMYGGYNSYNREDRRDLHRAPPMMSRNNKGGAGHSSGSANSTESLDKINRHNSKV